MQDLFSNIIEITPIGLIIIFLLGMAFKQIILEILSTPVENGVKKVSSKVKKEEPEFKDINWSVISLLLFLIGICFIIFNEPLINELNAGIEWLIILAFMFLVFSIIIFKFLVIPKHIERRKKKKKKKK